MLSADIKPTFLPLTRRSNQLSYTAAKKYYYLYKQAFSNESIHNIAIFGFAPSYRSYIFQKIDADV